MSVASRLARGAVRGQYRSYRRSRNRKGGPNTVTAWVIAAVAFLLMWPLATLILHGHLLLALVIIAVPSLALGAFTRIRVLALNQSPVKRRAGTGKLSDADRARLRAEAARETAAARQSAFDRFGLADPRLPRADGH
jgi:hypothetical protein